MADEDQVDTAEAPLDDEEIEPNEPEVGEGVAVDDDDDE